MAVQAQVDIRIRLWQESLHGQDDSSAEYQRGLGYLDLSVRDMNGAVEHLASIAEVTELLIYRTMWMRCDAW